MSAPPRKHLRISREGFNSPGREVPILLRPPRVVQRDGRYVAYENGIVCDCFSGTEWLAGPDRDFSWFEAYRWARDLTVGGAGWSLPAINQLRNLYCKNKNGDLLTPLLRIECTDVWSAEYPDEASAWGFNFIPGNVFKTYRSYSSRFRVLATRPKPDYRIVFESEDSKGDGAVHQPVASLQN